LLVRRLGRRFFKSLSLMLNLPVGSVMLVNDIVKHSIEDLTIVAKVKSMLPRES
jgi:hypothetical protein